jgi:hypothetical protein
MFNLEELKAPHPYYCSDSNYYSNDAGKEWETMTDFLAEFDNADVDMNLVFRFDVQERDEGHPGRLMANVYMIHQRKGIFSPHRIKHINESEAERFSLYLSKHWIAIQELWTPFALPPAPTEAQQPNEQEQR